MSGLPIGTRIDGDRPSDGDGPSEVAELLPARLNRHTFWCGQSGSGKTYALGVLLEQVLIRTALPIVVFDPNGDFTRLAEPAEAEHSPEHEHGPDHEHDAPDRAAIAARDIRVLRPGGENPLRARFASMSVDAKAAVLQLHPIVDRDEFNALVHADATLDWSDPHAVDAQLADSDDPVLRAIAKRIENLGLDAWNLWAFDRQAASEIIAERPDATVLDLGGFEHAEEQLTLALSVLEDLWRCREERRPVLLVVDEAHNLCSPDLIGPLATAVRDQLIRIAAEGRKFGLWLLLSTQRPSKVHPGILSQCDNVALMKTVSPADLDELARSFGFVPHELLEHVPAFRQGQGLFAGGFAAEPMIVQMADRITQQGGADVAVPLR